MTPINFEQSTRTLGAPLDWDEERNGPCGGLPVWDDGERLVSCWRPTWRERLVILFGGPVWLSVFARGHPPVAVIAPRRMFVDVPSRPAADEVVG